MLELVTFTGVDAHTDLKELARIANEYPRAEFAVLAGSQTGGDNPIFPPMDTVRALRNLDGVNTDLHLCGKYARMAAGETHAPHSLNLLCNGFGRVHVNLHGEAKNPERVQVRAARVIEERPDFAPAYDHAARCAFKSGDRIKGLRYAKEARMLGMPAEHWAWGAGTNTSRPNGGTLGSKGS